MTLLPKYCVFRAKRSEYTVPDGVREIGKEVFHFFVQAV